MKPHGAVVLITGASSGIGRAAALAFVRAGTRLVAHGRDAAALASLAAETGAHTLQADLAEPGAAAGLAVHAQAIWGRVDILVNNAGAGWMGQLDAIDPLTIERMVALNLTAPILLTRALLPAMRTRGTGHVVNVASIAGHVAVKHEAVYAATKAGLIAFTESLRYELAGSGVGATVVSPGVVATRFFERRQTAYLRAFPRPISAQRAGAAVVRSVRDNQDVMIPAWLALPAWLHGAWPSLYRALAARFG